jgi:hypothetical protein
MFNRKKIEELTHKNNILFDKLVNIEGVFNRKIELLEDEVWELKNPPKFNVLDKFSTSVITKIKLRNFRGYCSYSRRYWEYTMFDTSTNKNHIEDEDFLVSVNSSVKKQPLKKSTKKK